MTNTQHTAPGSLTRTRSAQRQSRIPHFRETAPSRLLHPVALGGSELELQKSIARAFGNSIVIPDLMLLSSSLVDFLQKKKAFSLLFSHHYSFLKRRSQSVVGDHSLVQQTAQKAVEGP
jgi:hypothetical protein